MTFYTKQLTPSTTASAHTCALFISTWTSHEKEKSQSKYVLEENDTNTKPVLSARLYITHSLTKILIQLFFLKMHVINTNDQFDMSVFWRVSFAAWTQGTEWSKVKKSHEKKPE